MVVRLTAYNNERDTVVNVESYKITYKQSKICTNLMNKPLLRMCTRNFDDLYLKNDQKMAPIATVIPQ